jgi:hypothetical protein
MKKITIIGIILVFGLICLGVGANYTHTEETEVLIRSLVTQQEIHGSGDKDGNTTISTTYKYLVNTDKGTYCITPEGLYHSNCFGSLEENKSYTITTRGYSFPLVGMYPYIISAYENTRN